MRAGLTDEEEVGFEVADELAEGLAAVQVVAEENGPEGAQFVDVGGQPALGGVAFAVLLAFFVGAVVVGVVLGLDKVGHQGQGAVVAVGDDGRGEHDVEVLLGFVLADMAGRTLVAVDGIRTLQLNAVKSDGHAPVEAQEGIEGAVVAGGLQAVGKQGGEVVGVVAIEEIANGVVARNVLDTEQGLAIGASGLLLHAALEVEEGGGLEEEGGESTGGGVGKAVALVGAGPGIRQGGGDLAESVEERLKDGNGGHTLCLKAVPEKSSPQKLVPHSRSCGDKNPQTGCNLELLGWPTGGTLCPVRCASLCSGPYMTPSAKTFMPMMPIPLA